MGSQESGRLLSIERPYKDVPERDASAALDQAAASAELARLATAHEQLLRYARDLKRAYEAERERRARLAQATLDLMTVLAVSLSPEGAARPADPIAVHAA